jgi:hypothetical protein
MFILFKEVLLGGGVITPLDAVSSAIKSDWTSYFFNALTSLTLGDISENAFPKKTIFIILPN